MKRFVFRLARLERLRELKRRQARAELANAMAELRKRQRRREDERTGWENGLRTELPAEIAGDSRMLKQLACWREHRLDCLRDAEAREERASEVAGRRFGEHSRASRDHRVIERLRERRYRRWIDELELEQRRFLDETHLLRLVRERGRRPDEIEEEGG